MSVSVIEGHYRASLGINPYESDILHESPIHLKFYSFLITNFGQNLPLAFIAADIITALGLYLFSKRYMLQLFIEQELEKHTYAKDSVNQLLKGKDLSLPPLYTVIVFLLNPYTIFNCVACTTSTFSNLVMTWFLVGTIYSKFFIFRLSDNILTWINRKYVILTIRLIFNIYFCIIFQIIGC